MGAPANIAPARNAASHFQTPLPFIVYTDSMWNGLRYIPALLLVVAAYWFVFVYVWGVLNGGDPGSWLP